MFFAIVAVIIDQHLFAPVIEFVLQASPHAQLSLFYLFNGLLSSISDNVFVGTVYINEAKAALEHGVISLQQFEMLAVAINTGTNLPSVATPNGQAAFLFLLTSALAPLIRLSAWQNGVDGAALYHRVNAGRPAVRRNPVDAGHPVDAQPRLVDHPNTAVIAQPVTRVHPG